MITGVVEATVLQQDGGLQARASRHTLAVRVPSQKI